jgi:histidyl-tRNA synthetase
MKYESPQELGRRTAVQDGLRDLFSSHGYQCIDTPLLEPTELFLRKSGGELAARMYTFTDPGGNRVSLRPEFTSSAIQYYLERADTEPLPLKLQYNGPVFRYDDSTGYRQFHQMGAEIIGSDEPSSDGEVLALAREGLSLLGVSQPLCVIGHVGVLHRMLDGLGISPRAQEFLIAGFPRLKQGDEGARTVQEQARSLGLLTSDNTARGLRMLIEGRDEAESFDLLQDLFQESLTGLLGSRTMEDILTRFTDKLQRVDDPQGLETGIALFSRLASIAGDEESALPQIRSVTEEFGLSPDVLTPLEEVLAGFHQRSPSVSLKIDIGLVRGIAYYTGMVFDILASSPDGPVVLCGGGRYNSLVKALGGDDDVPALGFAYTLENLLGLPSEELEERHLTSSNPQRR